MKPSDSSDELAAQFKKAMNRVAAPLKQLETSDTTLRHAQIQQSLESNGQSLHVIKRINQGLYVLIACVAFYFLLEAAFLGRRGLEIKELKPLAAQENIETPVTEYARWGELEQAMGRRNLF